MKQSPHTQGKLKKSYIVDIIVNNFNPRKYEFFDIVYNDGDARELHEFTMPDVFISFSGKIECYDTGSDYIIDDMEVTDLEIWDEHDRLVVGLVTPRQIENILKNINFNL